jgi:hypothetical protein
MNKNCAIDCQQGSFCGHILDEEACAHPTRTKQVHPPQSWELTMKPTEGSKAPSLAAASTVLALSVSDHFSTTASESEDLLPYSMEEMKASLGEGPMRFAPKISHHTTTTTVSTTTTTSDKASCSSASETHDNSSAGNPSKYSREKKCCEHLKRQWEASNPEIPFSYEMYLRLQCEKLAIAESRGVPSPDYTPFGLSIEELEPQLLTEVSKRFERSHKSSSQYPHTFLFMLSLSVRRFFRCQV